VEELTALLQRAGPVRAAGPAERRSSPEAERTWTGQACQRQWRNTGGGHPGKDQRAAPGPGRSPGRTRPAPGSPRRRPGRASSCPLLLRQPGARIAAAPWSPAPGSASVPATRGGARLVHDTTAVWDSTDSACSTSLLRAVKSRGQLCSAMATALPL
jgi:hypothetical protein